MSESLTVWPICTCGAAAFPPSRLVLHLLSCALDAHSRHFILLTPSLPNRASASTGRGRVAFAHQDPPSLSLPRPPTHTKKIPNHQILSQHNCRVLFELQDPPPQKKERKIELRIFLEGICATLNSHIQAPKQYIYYCIDIYLNNVILALSWGARKLNACKKYQL